MAKKSGRSTIIMENGPIILHSTSVVSKKESEGPLASNFDIICEDPMFGEDTWEKAESTMQKQALSHLFEKTDLSAEDIDFIFAGDLLNQCTGTSYGLKDFKIPFCGLYGACSTMAESLSLATIFTDTGIGEKCIAMTSSHFCSAEKQFRFPVQYGGQRTPTAQWTVTGAGALIVANKSLAFKQDHVQVKAVTIGTIEDLGVVDVNNMGAAMAPAAASTIEQFLEDTKSKVEDFDLIVTGDLGYVGSEILIDLLAQDGIDISKNHSDCGKLIYNHQTQDVHSGGSGCGCGASVLCSYVIKNMYKKTINNVLFIATGALMSPISIKQGQTIPCIAHLVHLSN